MKTVAILQARLASTRLPGKVLRPILGRPMLELMIERVSRSRRIDQLVVAVPETPGDDDLAAAVTDWGIDVSRGSENDVLRRVTRAAIAADADIVVRLTGDCPLHDSDVIDRAIDVFRMAKFDYVSNTLQRTFPDGLDVEVLAIHALRETDASVTDRYTREHVTPSINGVVCDGSTFTIGSFLAPGDFSHLRWTVDGPDDLEFVEQVFRRLYPDDPSFGWMDVLALITREPSLTRIGGTLQ